MSELDNRINELDENNAAVAKRYFTNGDILQQIFDIVRKKLPVSDPMGDYDSDTFILVNDDLSLNCNIIKIIKSFYDINKKNMYNTYITSYNKTINAKINDTLLQKELDIIKPKRIIFLGKSLSNDTHCINEVEFDIFKKAVGNKDLVTSKEYLAVKNKFIQLMKYIITGVD